MPQFDSRDIAAGIDERLRQITAQAAKEKLK